jgi:hypothetical protein
MILKSLSIGVSSAHLAAAARRLPPVRGRIKARLEVSLFKNRPGSSEIIEHWQWQDYQDPIEPAD